jgi:hypothetical protein
VFFQRARSPGQAVFPEPLPRVPASDFVGSKGETNETHIGMHHDRCRHRRLPEPDGMGSGRFGTTGRSLNGRSISKAGNPANSGGGSDSFFSKLLTAAVLACGATLPAVIGVCLGRENVGYVASFGAYLVTITHADLPIEGRAPRLASTIFMLCVGAIAGASAEGLHLADWLGRFAGSP